jgi:hypothetical protein
MDKIVMTLLVRRDSEESSQCHFAVQMAMPKTPGPGERTSFASVRLINDNGVRSSMFPSIEFRPDEWRAATLGEQADFAASFGGNPQPWCCVMHRLSRNVYDYPGAGDTVINNGQVWADTGVSARGKKTARRLALRCQQELGAAWDGRLLQAGREPTAADWIERRMFRREGQWSRSS